MRGKGGRLRGLSQWVQLCTWRPNNLWRSNSIFNLCLFRKVLSPISGYLGNITHYLDRCVICSIDSLFSRSALEKKICLLCKDLWVFIGIYEINALKQYTCQKCVTFQCQKSYNREKVKETELLRKIRTVSTLFLKKCPKSRILLSSAAEVSAPWQPWLPRPSSAPWNLCFSSVDENVQRSSYDACNVIIVCDIIILCCMDEI